MGRLARLAGRTRTLALAGILADPRLGRGPSRTLALAGALADPRLGQAVWVTLLSPRGESGLMPRRRDRDSVRSWPGTTRPIGASHSGSRGPASARSATAASAGPPPIA